MIGIACKQTDKPYKHLIARLQKHIVILVFGLGPHANISTVYLSKSLSFHVYDQSSIFESFHSLCISSVLEREIFPRGFGKLQCEVLENFHVWPTKPTPTNRPILIPNPTLMWPKSSPTDFSYLKQPQIRGTCGSHNPQGFLLLDVRTLICSSELPFVVSGKCVTCLDKPTRPGPDDGRSCFAGNFGLKVLRPKTKLNDLIQPKVKFGLGLSRIGLGGLNFETHVKFRYSTQVQSKRFDPICTWVANLQFGSCLGWVRLWFIQVRYGFGTATWVGRGLGQYPKSGCWSDAISDATT